MKLYIAGADKTMAANLALVCRDAGHEIVARWLAEPFKRTNKYEENERVQLAIKDVEDITAADAVVLCSSLDLVPGGKFVEAGVALGQMKMVYVLGRRENMLMWHPQILQFNNIKDLLEALGRVLVSRD